MTKTISRKSGQKAFDRSSPMPVRQSMDRFCPLAGIEALGKMLEEDAAVLCAPAVSGN